MAGRFLTGDLIEQLSSSLRGMARRPLEYCPRFPEIAARWEAWWRFEADRPLLVAAAAKPASAAKPGVEAPRGKGFHLLGDPEAWLDHQLRMLRAAHHAGESLPWIRADIGPVSVAAYVGAPIHFASEENTSWHDPIIHDWASRPPLRLQRDNAVYRQVLRLVDALAVDAPGRYLACMPDMTGAVDALANLRGSQQLCFDLLDEPEAVLGALPELLDAWEEAHAAIYRSAVLRGAGLVQWLGCWSDVPYIVPTCDFNALLGEADFARFCLPSLAEQARRCGRCCFHLDGPAAARHARALAEEPAITAIQYTTGAATPSAVAVLPMLKMIQSYRKPVLVTVPADEVEAVCAELDGRGLVVWAQDVQSPEHADALARLVAGRGK